MDPITGMGGPGDGLNGFYGLRATWSFCPRQYFGSMDAPAVQKVARTISRSQAATGHKAIPPDRTLDRRADFPPHWESRCQGTFEENDPEKWENVSRIQPCSWDPRKPGSKSGIETRPDPCFNVQRMLMIRTATAPLRASADSMAPKRAPKKWWLYRWETLLPFLRRILDNSQQDSQLSLST